MTAPKMQPLIDKNKSGKIYPWAEKKKASLLFAKTIHPMNCFTDKQKEKAFGCSDWLWFNVDQDGNQSFDRAFFCHLRLCPMCTWRRSLKLFMQMKETLEFVNLDKNKYSFLLLTLTVKNIPGEELNAAVDHLLKSFDKLRRRAVVKKAIIGWYRGLEVTMNTNYRSKSYKTFHPHIHILLVVKNSYFKSKDYIPQKQWCDLWKSCACLDYDPQVDIRKVQPSADGDIIKAVCEVTKYPVKDNDYIDPENIKLSRYAIECLHKAIKGRRLIAFGGLLKEVRAILHLDDVEEGDLNVHVEDSDVQAVAQVGAFFHTGLGNYFVVSRIPYANDFQERLTAQTIAEGNFCHEIALADMEQKINMEIEEE